ncbi:MAG: DUF349 domain-containing protein [Spirosomaceae bacterium]|nr:DUF349 domain-containing protein [Spirosomataceae bacterium]
MTNKDLELTENEINLAIVEPTTTDEFEAIAQIKETLTEENMTEVKSSIEADLEEVVDSTITKETEVSTVVEPAIDEVVAEITSTSPNVVAPIDTEIVVLEENKSVSEIEQAVVEAPIDEISAIEIHEDEVAHEEVDYSNFGKKDFVELAEKLVNSVKRDGATLSDIRNADNVMKEIKPIFDDLKAKEKAEALQKFIADNGNDEGFEYKNDNFVVRFESLNAQIRDARTSFYQKLEKEKESYFERKTQLLQNLRDVVEAEERGDAKNNWQQFKKIQEDWKNVGNVNSPHNASLWSAYNALIDRYFSIRHIQNELKDLDRKKNLTAKTEIVEKIEGIAGSISDSGLTNSALKQANELLEEYKHIGPAARDEQEKLWQRLKVAFDVIHNKRREQSAQASQLQEEVFEAKSRIFENIKPYAEFNTESISEWNVKTKEVLAIQDQWNAIKGAMPKEKGKEISRDFWALLKTFFRKKGEFFVKLEAERENNLKTKESLCEQVEALLSSGDFSPANTDRVIELQKSWKTIGHVPEKQKDKIFDRFKKACDAFFDGKRNKNNEVEKEYEANLSKKEALCAEIESAVKNGTAELSKLSAFKSEYAGIGFVPRKDMQNIQKRFVDAINAYVKASSGATGAEKEKIMLQNEVEVTLKGDKGGSKGLDKKEGDTRKRIKAIEDDIAVWRNNIEFFARSKNADSVRNEYEKKIKTAESEINDLKQKLKIIAAAN